MSETPSSERGERLYYLDAVEFISLHPLLPEFGYGNTTRLYSYAIVMLFPSHAWTAQ